MRIINQVLICYFSLLISGCILQSSQLNTIKDILRESDTDKSSSEWRVDFRGYTASIFAVKVDNGVLFSNSLGDQVLFDGWSIRGVKGMGKYQLHHLIEDDLNYRSFSYKKHFLLGYFCDKWIEQKKFGIKRFSKNCGDKSDYVNEILVDSDGRISLIRQFVDNSDTPMTLIKLN